MKRKSVKFEICGKDVTVRACGELNGLKGKMDNDGMAFFFGDGAMHIANTATGIMRTISSGGRLLVDDSEIDYESIARECSNGLCNARGKAIRYAGMNRWDGFKDGLCAISWMLYPDGCYFADSDGYGMDDNDEENVYAIMDTGLNIVEPFRPIANISDYLKKIRSERKG